MGKPVRNQADNARLIGIGQRVRWVREVHNVSQSELGRLYDTTQSKWSKIESGDAAPDALAMIQFCERFGVTLDFIFCGELDRRCDPDVALRLRMKHREMYGTSRRMAA